MFIIHTLIVLLRADILEYSFDYNNIHFKFINIGDDVATFHTLHRKSQEIKEHKL